MALALVATASAAPGSGGGTTAAIDTTGADLLVLGVGWYAAGGTLATPTDSKGNTWIALTAHGPGQFATHRFWYAKNAIVGAGHTFTATGAGTFANLIVHAFSGSHLTAPFDVESGASSSGGVATLASGSVTPTQNGSVVVTGYACLTNPGNSAETVTPTMTQTAVGTSATGRSLTGVLIQTTAAVINPTWSWSASNGVAVSTAVFKTPTGPADTARVSQLVAETLTHPTPDARLTQVVAETLTSTTKSAPPPVAQVTQLVVETLSRGLITTRVTQLVAETLTATPVPRVPLAVTQLAAEILQTVPLSPLAATQLAAEVVLALPPQPDQARVTQLLAEVIVVPRVPVCVTDFPIEPADDPTTCAVSFPITAV